jgi:hypothetical protein
MRKNSFNSNILLMQIAIGIYFGIYGLLGIMGYDIGNNWFLLVRAILFMLSGLVLVVGGVTTLRPRVLYYLILILWIVYLILTHFTESLLAPDVLSWVKNFSRDLIVFSGLWIISQNKSFKG